VDRQLSLLIAGLDKAVATVAGKIQSTMALTERYVDPTEIDKVMAFFRAHWDPQHILGHDREFLIWQFSPERCAGFEQAGLSAATLWDGNKLVGFLGVIGCGFNGSGTVVHGAWLCNLIVLPQYRPVGGWMRLMSSVHRLPINVVGVVTFPPNVDRLYRAMGYYTQDRLFRFVRIVDPEQMAQLIVGNGWRAQVWSPIGSQVSSDLKIESVTTLDQSWDRFWRCFTERGYFGTNRDARYMLWRYLRHPRLRHVIKVALAPGGEIRGAAVYRVEQVKGHPVRVMRLLELMALDNADYECLLGAVARDGEDLGVAFIDHYTTRALHPIFADLGWLEEDDIRETVPGLFQPLVRARRTLNVGVRLLGASALSGLDWTPHLHVVKSDGDQDRPN
jgi:hypothetical protein